MKITPFDELYTSWSAGYGTVLGTAGGSNGFAGGDVVGTPGDLSVVGLRQQVSLQSNLTPVSLGDVLTIVQASPAQARFATPSNTSTGSNSMLRTGGGWATVTTIAASGAAQQLMFGGANTFDITLTASCTFTFTGAAPSGNEANILLILRQDGTGNRTVTWPGSVSWATGSAPTLQTAASAVDFVILESIDGGSTWVGFVPAGQSGTASPLTTKGDIYTYGSNNARRAVGSNGMLIVADPLEDVGWRWTTNPAVGEIMISSTPSIPLTFSDLLTNSLGDDLVYGSR